MSLNGKLVAELWMNKPGLEWLIDRQEVEVLTNKPDLKLKFGKWVLSCYGDLGSISSTFYKQLLHAQIPKVQKRLII